MNLSAREFTYHNPVAENLKSFPSAAPLTFQQKKQEIIRKGRVFRKIQVI